MHTALWARSSRQGTGISAKRTRARITSLLFLPFIEIFAPLPLPMDVHVHRISRRIGLTRRKTADLTASREATGWLRLLNPEDPVVYDWPLSRLGILSQPMTLPTRIAARA